MNTKNTELISKLAETEKLLTEIEKKLKTYKNLAPGNIRITESHGCVQYFHRIPGKEQEKYISKIEKESIHLLAQRDYEEKVKKELLRTKNRLEKFIAGYDADAIDKIYERMCDARKDLVTPIVPTEAMYIEQWMEEHTGNLNTYGEATAYKTQRGEYVRSKSEKILADSFYSNTIPYQYEPRYELNDYRSVYPDFVLLNVKKRKTIYWEHLGLADNIEYASQNFNKLIEYEKSGLTIGNNLIITMETSDNPLDVSMIEEKIRLFLQ